jgi:uroporphyrinogen-III synthase
VRAFAAASHRFELPAFCVGEASAAAARIAGFRTVFSGDGDVGELAALVAARLSPHHGALLHVAGAATAGDLSGQLGHADFTARRAVLYRAVPVDALASELVAALHQGEIDLALFFSPRTAESFVRLALGVGVGERCESMTALALSRNVASPLGTLPWRAIAIADAPTLSALMTALDETLAGSRSA